VRRLVVVGAGVLAVLPLVAVETAPVQAAKPCSVPKAWGQLRNVCAVTWQATTTQLTHMAFEDAEGTVRVLNRNKCEPVKKLDVQRTP